MLARQSHIVCLHASESLAHTALSTGRISVIVDPAKEPLYNEAIDGLCGEPSALTAYIPIPNHRDTSTFIAVLVLAHILPPFPTTAAETRQKHVSVDTVELLTLVSVMLSAPLSRSLTQHASDMRLSECAIPTHALFARATSHIASAGTERALRF